MRMLAEEEREFLALPEGEDGDLDEESDDDVALCDRLIECGRLTVRVVELDSDNDWIQYRNTEWGHKALRVDAIARGLEVQS